MHIHRANWSPKRKTEHLISSSAKTEKTILTVLSSKLRVRPHGNMCPEDSSLDRMHKDTALKMKQRDYLPSIVTWKIYNLI